jgi:hypothetical protein
LNLNTCRLSRLPREDLLPDAGTRVPQHCPPEHRHTLAEVGTPGERPVERTFDPDAAPGELPKVRLQQLGTARSRLEQSGPPF